MNRKFGSDSFLRPRKRENNDIIVFMENAKNAMDSLMYNQEDPDFFLSGRKFSEALKQYTNLANHWTSNTISSQRTASRSPSRWGKPNHPMGDLLEEMCPTMVQNRPRSCSPEKAKTRTKILEGNHHQIILPIHRNEEDKSRSQVRELTIFYENTSNKNPPIPSTKYLPPKNDKNAVKHVTTSQKIQKVAAKRERNVHFEPIVLLFSATIEGDLELVIDSLKKVSDCDISKDDGLTALHTAICAQRDEIAEFLISYGCDVNAMDGDGWTPLHCAAICNNLKIIKLLIEAGAAPFAFTNDVDPETPLDKCSEGENGYEECKTYLLECMMGMGSINAGLVYATHDFEGGKDELSFKAGQRMKIVDINKDLWWWTAKIGNNFGFVPKNFLCFYPQKKTKNNY